MVLLRVFSVLIFGGFIGGVVAGGKGVDEEVAAIAGRWSPDCEVYGGVTVNNENSAFIEVNSNQIYIRAKVKEDQGFWSFILVDPEELGRGGMQLAWPDYSRSHVIARFSMRGNASGELNWFGFLNERTGDMEWTDEPDFLLGSGRLVRCFD